MSKRTRPLLRLALALVCVQLLGAAPAIRFTVPPDGTEQTHMPQTIVLDFDAAASDASLVVELNGTDVTSAFAIAPPIDGRKLAMASDVWDALVPGANALHAEVDVGAATSTTDAGFVTVGDPYADAVVSTVLGTSGGFNVGALPDVVLGAPAGTGLLLGSLDVYSLGFGGSMVVEFTDNVIADREGVDFTVFENAILEIGAGQITDPPFAEPGRVSVSQDGVTWFDFPCSLTMGAAPYWPGCAGVYPVLSDGTPSTPHPSIPSDVAIDDLVGVSIFSLPLPPGSGGDSFDLADVGLTWARFVKIEGADFATGPVGVDNGGFDLDAVVAVNSTPQVPSLPGLSLLGAGLLSACLLAAGARLSGRATR